MVITKIRDLKSKNIIPSNIPLVIGYFGSVHVMHSILLNKYHNFNVLTFKDFKSKVISQIYSFHERLKNIESFHPENIYVYDINHDNMKAEEFIEKILMKIKPSSIVVGSNFRFGSDHQSYKILKKYFPVDIINHNKKVSSSIVAKLLASKKIERANDLLFTPYYFISKWIAGDKRGRELGIRTINLLVDHKLAVTEGSYVSRITIGLRTYQSVTFVGKSKTFAKAPYSLETFVIDKKIPPRRLVSSNKRNAVKVEFLKYLRANKKFNTAAQLVKAIKKDIDSAKAYFAKNK